MAMNMHTPSFPLGDRFFCNICNSHYCMHSVFGGAQAQQQQTSLEILREHYNSMSRNYVASIPRDMETKRTNKKLLLLGRT